MSERIGVSSPNNTLADAFFGYVTQTVASGLGAGGAGLSPLSQVGGPRSIQLVLRLEY